MDELNLQNHLDQYLQSMVLKGQSPKTLKEKRLSLNRFCSFLAGRALTSQIAFDYIIYLKTKPVRPYKDNSLSFEITMLKTFEKWLLKQGYIQEPWTTLLERPQKQAPLKNFLYVDPLLIDRAIVAGTESKPYIRRGLPGDNAINAFRKEETRQCLKFVSRRGLRITEALRLTGNDLNFAVAIPEFRIAPIKRRPATWVQIPADMVEELRKRKDKVRVFETTESLCNISLQRGWDMIGLSWPEGDVHNHILRHQYATHLLKMGVPMEKVQIAMRHSSIKITIDTYSHLTNCDVDPLVQAADPRTRAALEYDRQVAFVQEVLEKLSLQGNNVSVALSKDQDKFTFTMSRNP